MKLLVTTSRALQEVATGLDQSAIASHGRLHTWDVDGVRVLVHSDDSLTTQRLVVVDPDDSIEFLVPPHLVRLRREVASRLANVLERARTLPLTLPKSWGQFRHDNLLTFFSTPPGIRDPESTRCIIEVSAFGSVDLVLWRWTTSADQTLLADLQVSSESVRSQVEASWSSAFQAFTAEKAERSRTLRTDTFIDLEMPKAQDGRQRSYDEWLDAVSHDQRAFIEAPTTKSIKLRGPAGSGKSLALALKAVRECLEPIEDGARLRVLIATHSWSLAEELSAIVDRLAVDVSNELEIFPLLEIARELAPKQTAFDDTFELIGRDSLSAKQTQLDEIELIIEEFLSGDWVAYRESISETLRARFESNDEDVRLALAWDLLIEFGSVIGAAGIFPGAGAGLRYRELPRSPWMLPLASRADHELIFALYSQYMQSLDDRSLVTGDQVLADFLQYLESHAWNRGRRQHGYDLIFVDEFHLFSPLERQVLHFLTRSTADYPRLFMALDPRQSPAEALIGGASDSTSALTVGSADGDMGDVKNFELTTVHRFTPQILDFVKHLHHSFPAWNLGQDWDVDITAAESAVGSGPVPLLHTARDHDEEASAINNAVHAHYGKGRIAIAVVDAKQWSRFSRFGTDLGRSGKFHVVAMSERVDAAGLGYRKHGVVIAPAEYLAGLQFETVLVVGLPDLRAGAQPAVNERTRLLSVLYLAVTRAESRVEVFTNEDHGGVPEVLTQARGKKLLASG